MQKEKLKQEYVSLSHERRREAILVKMKKLNSDGFNCYSCVGHCCNSYHNSMMITPLEALDIYFYLEENNRINNELINQLNECIKNYRLDVDVYLGRKGNFRRYYTCPFYAKGTLGCSLSKKYKPYGCLAFNPTKKNVSTEGHCRSDRAVLLEADELISKENLNEKLSLELNISWDKKSIPCALLWMIEKLN